MQVYTDEYHALCSAIGFVAVNWAITEQGLDGCVSMIFHYHGGKSIQKQIPRSLEKKIDFLKKCFKQIPSLQSLKDDANNLLAELKPLSKRRHDLIHGAITSLTSKNGVFEFAKLDYGEQIHIVRTVHLDLNQFDDLAKQILDLGTKVADLGIRIEAPLRELLK